MLDFAKPYGLGRNGSSPTNGPTDPPPPSSLFRGGLNPSQPFGQGQNESSPICICWQKPTVARRELFHILHADERGKRRKSSPSAGVVTVIIGLAEDGGSVGGSQQ